MAQTFEVNFDGLVGPTHNYSGLSFGNIASTTHKAALSNPKEAALQGLQKMRFLTQLGLQQGILPPQERPDLRALRRLGFTGSDAEILQKAKKEAPEILSAVWSGSSMWTANAGTTAASADTADHRVHFTPANLTAKFHRSIEPETTGRILKAIFPEGKSFAHHPPLPAGDTFGDEGAANHTRFCDQYSNSGIHFFVYGRKGFIRAGDTAVFPKLFPARQTLEASMSIARLHQLDPQKVVYAQQNPEAIDAGVFHNDVVAVGNLDTLFYHEESYVSSDQVIRQLQEVFRSLYSKELKVIKVPSQEVSLKDAVKSYLFNSQLIALPNQSQEMALIAPSECQENAAVKKYLAQLVTNTAQPIRKVHFFDLRQSMRNGGGPACLRFRVTLTENEVRESNSGVYLTDSLYTTLCSWVNKHYRDQLSLDDLTDPALIQESRNALDELTQILKLGSIYPFQSLG